MKKSILLLGIICLLQTISAQTLNYGLSEPQDSGTFPKSRAKLVLPERKIKQKPNPRLIKQNYNQWKITGGWELADSKSVNLPEIEISSAMCNTKDWYNATVPGTILLSLVKQGVFPDPYYGLNNLAIPDTLCRTDWWYRTEFNIPAEVEGKKISLIFNGINYRAEVWVNGNKTGRIDGAFIRGTFDVTKIIHGKEVNVLAVHIFPPDHPGIPQEASPLAGRGPNGGAQCADGPTFIATEGWDWVPGIRDRCSGIWQDVLLKASGDVELGDVNVISDLPLPDTTKAALALKTVVLNNSQSEKNITLKANIENISIEKKLILKAGEKKEIVLDTSLYPQLNIIKPRLWWPNGYGKPELYKLSLSVIDEKGEISDHKEIKFGIREISYELTVNYKNHKNARVEFNPVFALKKGLPVLDNSRSKDEIQSIMSPKLINDADSVLLLKGENEDCAPYMVIKVNGKRIYCKGGNWGMDDGMKQVSRQKLEPYIKLHRKENFNMLRNWTGESAEEDLYQLCDEYGILVYNEFWYSTEYYNLEPWDNALFINNARDVIRRFRNHPSIALWGARNEGFPSKVLEDSLRAVIAKEDGTRLYQPSSTLLNMNWSGSWNFRTDPVEYYTSLAGGFKTELGTVSVPTAESMRKMMPVEDLWPIGDTWYYHDFNYSNEEFVTALNTLYGKAENLDDFCRKAQMMNYDNHRCMFEGFNSKMWNNTTGLLLWMSHPAWPSTIWQTYTWDYETHASFFGCKKACEPVHIQMNLNDNKIVIVNTTLSQYKNVQAFFSLYNIDGKLICEKSIKTNIPENRRVDCFTAELPQNLPSVYLLRLKLTAENGETLSQNDYWKKREQEKSFEVLNTLPDIELTAGQLEPKDGCFIFRISNQAGAIAVSVKLNLRDTKTNKAILPAYFSDGYFQLLPGESKLITLEYPQKELRNLKITCEGYNIKRKDLININ